MKKLLVILLAVCCSTRIFAQADPLIQNTLMSPNPLGVGQIGQLTTDVRNNGAVNITAGCVIVSISVPSLICGATLTLNTGSSSPIWTVLSSGVGFIDLKNTGGILPTGATSFPIVLNVSGDARGGPSTIQAVISYAPGGGCSGLGDSDPLNNSATTNLSVYGIYTWVGGNTGGGTAAERWSNTLNWSPAAVPFATDKAIIPNVIPGGKRLPRLTADAAINDIQIDANASVNISASTFTINGVVTGTGTLKGSSTSSLVIGGNAGTLNFAPGSQSLWNLNLNANALATLGTALDIAVDPINGSGTLIVDAGAILTTNGNLTIKSDVNGTSSIGPSAGTITGNATIERYVKNIGRKWRLLSGKTIGSTQTIRNAWQEGGTVVSNKGTWVTKPGGGNGYDGSSNNPGLLKYNFITNTWGAVAATDGGTSINDEQGYMLFVRGDRFDLPSNASNSATVLRTTGTLNQHAQPVITIPPGGSSYTLVGNPFASSLDFETFHGITNLNQDFYIWDGTLTGAYSVGGYRIVSRDNIGNYDVTPPDGIADISSMRYISSGQAVFLKASGGNANLVLDEGSKSGNAPEVLPIVAGGPADQQLLVSMYYVNAAGIASPVDGIRVRFNDIYTAGTADDAEKVSNFGDNIASLRDNKLLIVERRPMIVSHDTIFLRTSNLGIKNYRLKTGTISFVQTDATAYLEDTYLKTMTKLNLTGADNFLDFSVTADAGSAAPDRFRIVFELKIPTTITLNAAQQGSAIAVDWKASNQNNMKQYEVEKSTDGTNFSKVETKAATGINGSTVTYNWLDVNPVAGDNYYRIRSTDLNAVQKYTEAVKVNIKAGQPEITIYPNPVTDKIVRVKFANMTEGIYRLSFINSNGQVMLTKDIRHPGGTAIQPVNIKNMAAGNYHLEIVNPNKSKTIISLNVLN